MRAATLPERLICDRKTLATRVRRRTSRRRMGEERDALAASNALSQCFETCFLLFSRPHFFPSPSFFFPSLSSLSSLSLSLMEFFFGENSPDDRRPLSGCGGPSSGHQCGRQRKGIRIRFLSNLGRVAAILQIVDAGRPSIEHVSGLCEHYQMLCGGGIAGIAVGVYAGRMAVWVSGAAFSGVD